jgi:hypothetical protein
MTRMAHLVEHDDLSAGIDVKALLHSLFDDVPRGQPCLGVVVEEREELFPCYPGGFREFGLLISSCPPSASRQETTPLSHLYHI